MKRFILVIQIIFFLSYFSGCKNNDTTLIVSSTVEKDDPLDVPVLRWAYPKYSGLIPEDRVNELNKYLMSKGAGYTIEMVPIDGVADEYVALLESLEVGMLDIASTGLWYSDWEASKFAGSGFFRELTRTEFPELFSLYSEDEWNLVEVNHKFFSIPAFSGPLEEAYYILVPASDQEKWSDYDGSLIYVIRAYELEKYEADKKKIVLGQCDTKTVLALFSDLKIIDGLLYDPEKKTIVLPWENEKCKSIKRCLKSEYFVHESKSSVNWDSTFAYISMGALNVEKEALQYKINDSYLNHQVGATTGIVNSTKQLDLVKDFLLRLYSDRTIADYLVYGIKANDYEVNELGYVIMDRVPNSAIAVGLYDYATPLSKDSHDYYELRKTFHASMSDRTLIYLSDEYTDRTVYYELYNAINEWINSEKDEMNLYFDIEQINQWVISGHKHNE